MGVAVMSFPGIEQIERGHFVLTQGITPSVAVLEIEPQDPTEIPLDGTLTVTDDDVTITFPDSVIDRASFDYGPDGLVWRLQIYDRRWKWRYAGPYGPVAGVFNERYGNIQPAPANWQLNDPQQGSLDPDTLATPQQLAAMLLDALGETGYDVSALPNTTYPEVLWDNDNPAQVLEALAEKLGCRIVLNLDNTVAIVQVGIGADLPGDGIEQESDVLDPPELPDSIAVVGGRSRFQVDLKLVPVGLDVDGTIKDIWDLSYAPTQYLNGKQPTMQNLGGWGNILQVDPEVGFSEIAGWEVEDVIPPLTPPNIQKAWLIEGDSPQVNPRYLGRQSVWRWYRVAIEFSADSNQQPPLIPGWGVAYGDGPNGPPPNPNGQQGNQRILNAGGNNGAQNPPAQLIKQSWGTRIQELWQILPLGDKQLLGWYDNVNQWQYLDAIVYGLYWSPSWDGLMGAGPNIQDANFNFTSPTPVGVNYTIDRERGLVMFDEPVYLFDGQNIAIKQPVLYLRTTVSPRVFATRAPDRFFLQRDLGGNRGTGPLVLKREEIVRNVIPQYDAKFNVTTLFTNDLANIAEANAAIDAALVQFQATTPQDVTYMGIRDIGVDGAITQVSWTVGPEGATTRAARNTEVHPYVPSFRERQLLAGLGQTTETMRRLQDQERKQ